MRRPCRNGAAPWNGALILLALLAAPVLVHAQGDAESRNMNRPVPPFHLVGDIYYVGASDVTSFLIVTPAGDILLDGGFVQTAPQIEANIRRLGFRLSGVKILLNSHAHFDHAGGLAELKRRTGAQLVAMQGDAALLARGGRGDFYFGDRLTFPPIKPDRIIHDGDKVALGGVTLTAHLTAGHTRGCTTWTMTTEDRGKLLHVVFIGSMSVLSGYRLVGKESYPGITADYQRSFGVLRALPCDVFLGAHGQFFHLTEKREALVHSPSVNPFIDPDGYRAYIDSAELAFQAALRRQRAALKPHKSSELLAGRGAACLPVREAGRARFELQDVAYPANGAKALHNRAPAGERTAQAVMKVEHAWLDALQRRDVETLARTLAAEFIDNDYQGGEITRAEYLSYFARPLAHPAPAVSQHFEDTKVRFVAKGEVAIVTGVVRTEPAASPNGSSATGPASPNSVRHSRFTDVFLWRDSRWQAVTAQETHFSPSPR
jgi:metallo-beta-lactamase class B